MCSPPPPSTEHTLSLIHISSVHELFAAARLAVDQVCTEPCRDPSDKLRIRLDEIAARLAELAAMPDELDLLEALGPNACLLYTSRCV